MAFPKLSQLVSFWDGLHMKDLSQLHALKLHDGDSGKGTQIIEAVGTAEMVVSQVPTQQALEPQFNLQNIHKKPDVAVHTCNPSTG